MSASIFVQEFFDLADEAAWLEAVWGQERTSFLILSLSLSLRQLKQGTENEKIFKNLMFIFTSFTAARFVNIYRKCKIREVIHVAECNSCSHELALQSSVEAVECSTQRSRCIPGTNIFFDFLGYNCPHVSHCLGICHCPTR